MDINLSFPSPFLLAQSSGWYPLFLKPVVDAVNAHAGSGSVLDVGTGPGMLPKLLSANRGLDIVGTDVSPAMLSRAQATVTAPNVRFLLQKPDALKRFPEASFDVVTMCSVLFLLDEQTRNSLLNQAARILGRPGRLIVLTPSSQKSGSQALTDLSLFPFSVHNWTFVVWNNVTSSRAKRWHEQQPLRHFARHNDFAYADVDVFHGYAKMETLSQT